VQPDSAGELGAVGATFLHDRDAAGAHSLAANSTVVTNNDVKMKPNHLCGYPF
jgi:hypothetical protein